MAHDFGGGRERETDRKGERELGEYNNLASYFIPALFRDEFMGQECKLNTYNINSNGLWNCQTENPAEGDSI